MGDPSSPSSSLHRRNRRPSRSPHHRRPTEGDDMMKALSQSVSFGRFMSESLDWERWSSFTRNRNLEEAEMTSKPGSVALRKAYFEANRRAKAPTFTPLASSKPHSEACSCGGDSNGGKCSSSSRRRRSWGKENKLATSTTVPSSNEHVNLSGGKKSASSSSSSSRKIYSISKEEAMEEGGEKKGGGVASASRSGKRSKMKGESPVGGKRMLSSSPTSSVTTCAPFSFRCEERAVRRKEFFQKLEENMKEREANKLQEDGDTELRRQWMNVVCKHKSAPFLNSK